MAIKTTFNHCTDLLRDTLLVFRGGACAIFCLQFNIFIQLIRLQLNICKAFLLQQYPLAMHLLLLYNSINTGGEKGSVSTWLVHSVRISNAL